MKNHCSAFIGLIVLSLFSRSYGRPHDNCYWVEEGRLLASEYPTRALLHDGKTKLKHYADAGVTCFIDLTEEHETNCSGPLRTYTDLLRPEVYKTVRKCEYYRMPFKDNTTPSMSSMHAIVDKIIKKIAEGHTVCVHCWGGVGRTGLVAGCYLVEKGMTGEQALDFIAQLWKTTAKIRKYPRSPHTHEQHAFVRSYQRINSKTA